MKLLKRIIGCAAAFAVAATVGFSAVGCKKNEEKIRFYYLVLSDRQFYKKLRRNIVCVQRTRKTHG